MFTVKQIADLLGVSKPTVQKVINENFIEADKIVKTQMPILQNQSKQMSMF